MPLPKLNMILSGDVVRCLNRRRHAHGLARHPQVIHHRGCEHTQIRFTRGGDPAYHPAIIDRAGACAAMTFDRLLMILGAPRSGTSWLGKIFDSHPDVLYRHEPDLALWDRRLPFLIPQDQVHAYTAIARDYVNRLLSTPTLKSSGQLPSFPKSYHAPPLELLRTAMIHGLRWVEAASGARRMRSFPIPDLISPAHRSSLRIVVKSISARGRARVFMEALPGMRAIFLMRHPCGQVASTLRGTRQGKFNTGVFVRDVLATPGASKYGLTDQRLSAASDVEQLAWHWATMNELAAEAMADPNRARIVRYEDICRGPLEHARELFAFSGLDWSQQTEAFIERSTHYSGTEKYYSVFRNAAAAAERWRTELSNADQRVIMNVVAQTSLARLWDDASGHRGTVELSPRCAEPNTARV